MLRIKSFEPYGEELVGQPFKLVNNITNERITIARRTRHGWQWVLIDHDGEETRYNTNKSGEGLWRDDKQVTGTGQLTLPATRKAARQWVYRHYIADK